ncbi:MAG: dihydropteroate synthase [Flavobacterium sp.]
MTINCKGNLIDLSNPKIMGILNLTPDSFFDGGKNFNIDIAIKNVSKMLEEGADFIDIGAYSSRPNAVNISVNEEIDRLIPVLIELNKTFPKAHFSIDTFRSEVAEIALENGACMINDISGGSLDQKMFEIIAKFQVPYVMMHLVGTPQNMTQNTAYQNLITEILFYFSEKINIARTYNINDIIIDPGFGFSKTIDQNFELLQNMKLLEMCNLPILAGISRKSMIYKTLETTPEFALNGTTALNMTALQNGANILRVHEVKEAKECITLFNKLQIYA